MMTASDSLYSKYIFERLGHLSIWEPNGFVFYKLNEKECFIAEFFVDAHSRDQGLGRKMLEELQRRAEANGCEIITANIWTEDPGCNDTLLASMACGFRVVSSGHNVLLISKKVRGL